MRGISTELEAKLARLAASEGVELVAVELGGGARRPVLRLVLDRAQGGVSLDDCERVSRQASVLLDAYDPFPGAFTLEVASPGLDRKLYRQSDFDRFAGQPVRVRMRPTWPGGRLITGTLVARREGAIHLRTGPETVTALPETEVMETRLDPFPREDRRQQRGRKKP